MLYTWKAAVVAAAGVLALGVGWRAYDGIYERGRSACRAEFAQVAHATAEREREEAEAQSARDAAAAKAQARARLDQLSRRHALERDIARRPTLPDCGLDGVAVGLLNDAVRAGNASSAPAAGGLPDGVPAGAGAAGREPGGAAAVGE